MVSPGPYCVYRIQPLPLAVDGTVPDRWSRQVLGLRTKGHVQDLHTPGPFPLVRDIWGAAFDSR